MSAPTPSEADVCGVQCDHGSECMKLRGHEGGHETQHGCIAYEPRADRADRDAGHVMNGPCPCGHEHAMVDGRITS